MDEGMHRDIDALDDEMTAAGVRIFVGGLHPAHSAKSLRGQPDGEVLITDGPYAIRFVGSVGPGDKAAVPDLVVAMKTRI
jgi:hypothetical protein